MAGTTKSDAALAASVAPIPESRLLRLPVFCGITAAEIEQSIETAAEAGFNGIVAPLALGGLPLFASDTPKSYRLAPRIPEFRGRDVLAEITGAAREHHIRVYGIVNPRRPEGDPPARTVAQWFRRRRDWLARGSQSLQSRRPQPNTDEISFCLANPDCRRYWADLILEAVERYPLAGLMIDASGWPMTPQDQPQCHCGACRESAREAGAPLEAFADGTATAQQAEAWADWRLEAETALMAYISQRCQKPRRGLLIRARAAALSADAEPKAGDVKSLGERLIERWLSEGIIDGLDLGGLPRDPEEFAATVERNLEVWPEVALLYPVIASSDPADVAEKVAALRERPVMGCIVEWGEALSEVAAEHLAEGCFAEPAFVAADSPLQSLRLLLTEIAHISPVESGLSDYLADMVKHIENPIGATRFEALEAMAENLRGLETRVLEGQIEFGDSKPKVLNRLRQALRLARLASHQAGI